MRTYPSQHIKKKAKAKAEHNVPVLTPAENITKWLALIVAGVTVYYFFIKILFL